MTSMERARAEESVAKGFSRAMNATPSPYGFLSDVVFASVVAAGIAFVGLLVVSRLPRPATLIGPVFALAAVPVLVSVGVSIALRRTSRARVIDWIASLPFDVVNLNAVLAGFGDTVEVVFAGRAHLPTRDELAPKLDALHPEILLTDERPELSLVAIRLGVIDAKRFPMRTSHMRWVRLREVVEHVLLPMHGERPIERLQFV
jgi:hypothetical protein